MKILRAVFGNRKFQLALGAAVAALAAHFGLALSPETVFAIGAAPLLLLGKAHQSDKKKKEA